MGRSKRSTISNKISSFIKSIEIQPFILLARPKKNIYREEKAKKKFFSDMKFIIDRGLLNLEIPWEDNQNWCDLVSDLRSSFPKIQLGSASLLNKKSIDDSIRLGLDFSMMRFWQKDLYIYSKKNNYLLIPGLINNVQFNSANSSKCKIIKIFPVENKEDLLDIKLNQKVCFIAAGGISINDLNKFQSLGFKGIVIGSKGYDGDQFDPKIINYLKFNFK